MSSVAFFLAGLLVAFALVLLVQRLASFRAQTPDDYASGVQSFDIRAVLNGPIDCEGVIYGPMGRVASRFCAQMNADWQGNKGRMTEFFTYDSGTTQNREWRLSVDNQGRITAEADDLVGTGTGWQSGDAVQLKYRIRLPQESGGHVLDVTDWMYLAPNGAVVNRSQFRKFGIKVAELVATMRRKEDK